MNLEDMLANDDKDDVENADEPFEKDDVIEISAKAGSSQIQKSYPERSFCEVYFEKLNVTT